MSWDDREGWDMNPTYGTADLWVCEECFGAICQLDAGDYLADGYLDRFIGLTDEHIETIKNDLAACWPVACLCERSRFGAHDLFDCHRTMERGLIAKCEICDAIVRCRHAVAVYS